MKRNAVTALLLLLLVTTAAGTASADEGAEAFVREVLDRSPALRAVATRRRSFEDAAVAASKWPDPQAAIMLDRLPDRMAEMPMVRYQLSQMVMWPGKLGLMRAAVERRGDAAAADVDTRKLELRLAARRGWAMLRYNARRREVNRASRGLATIIANAALGRYGAGVGGHHEVVRAQVEANALDVELVDLEGERASTIAMLNALRDRPADAPIQDPGPLGATRSDFTLTALTEKAVLGRPELRGMRAMRGEAVAMADLARKQPYPDLMGSVWFNQMIGGPGTAGVMVGGAIPVFGLSRSRHQASAFDARAEAAVEDQAQMRAMIRFEVADALTRVRAAARQVELLETVAIPKTRESFDASLAGFGTATVDIVGVLDARRALQTSELARAEAGAALEIALAELERAVGGPPGGGAP